MTHSSVAVVILAAGKGTRMKSDLPKVLHRLAGRPMIRHVLDAAGRLNPCRVGVVVGPGMDDVAEAAAPAKIFVQTSQAGTADAVRAAAEMLRGFDGDVIVLYGDTPLITTETMMRMVGRQWQGDNPAVVVLGFRPDDPGAYGRLIVTADGTLEKIVEYADADAAERAVGLCNAGLMVFDGRRMLELLDRIDADNAKGEFYLTDAVGIARAAGYACAVVEAPEAEVMGVNCRAELAVAEKIIQQRLRRAAMDEGATLIDPDTTYFSPDTKLGRDVVVGPGVFFGPGVRVADKVEIKAFCHLEGVTIAEGATIGPFARLRPGAVIGPAAHVGNFVEIKNGVLAEGAKVNHLTYIGDATIGAKANIGAGTITCNYDGFTKSKTEIGAGAFIGSNSSLVAPVKIGDGAIVGAGSVVVKDVEADALSVARGRQQNYIGWAAKFRSAKKK